MSDLPRPGDYQGWTGYGTCPTCGIACEHQVEPIKEGPFIVGTRWYCGICGSITQMLYEKGTQ